MKTANMNADKVVVKLIQQKKFFVTMKDKYIKNESISLSDLF